ncbi:MAG: RNA methyltransferase, partial [Lentisphaerae bacterium]|nr:RNA methyltransferase [Lentisphaerota bacterium]
CGYTATPEHANVAKSAMGTEKILQWRTFINIRDAVTELQESEITIYALETTTGAKDIAKVEFKLPAALLVGNERFGLDPEVLQLADEVVSIHRYGIKNSLNVVSATAIAVHAINLYKTSLPRNTP